jgi:hypothetical protein
MLGLIYEFSGLNVFGEFGVARLLDLFSFLRALRCVVEFILIDFLIKSIFVMLGFIDKQLNLLYFSCVQFYRLFYFWSISFYYHLGVSMGQSYVSLFKY